MLTLTSDLLAEIQSPAELENIQRWMDDLVMIAEARPQAPVVALVAQRRQCSIRSVYNKLKAVQQSGPLALRDGRNRRKTVTATAGHRSPQFIQFVHSLYYRVARNNATPAVYDLLINRLRAWRSDPSNSDLAIPGYSTPPLDSAESRYRHPFGWSKRQLNEIKPDKFQTTEGRLGRQHSNELLPPVLTTRVGLPVGAAYMFDDQYNDNMVHFGDKLVRPVGINCLDLASACDVARGVRPMLPDNPDGDKALNRSHTLWLVVHLLTVEGYHRDACQLIFEAGGSTVNEEFARLIALATDSRVSVKIGEVGKDIVRGVLLPSKGNPRFKAARESWFNLLRNRCGFMPLALGMNRDQKPEDTDRLVAEDQHLLQIAKTLPPAVVADLQFEGLPWSRFVPLYNQVCEGINLRTEHELEGWAAEGRERIVYRIGEEWVSEHQYLRLPPETRALVVHRMREGEVVSRIEKASPREIYESGRPQLRKVSPYRWHLLIPHSYAIPRTIPSNRMLEINRREYGPEPIHFQPFYYPEGEDKRPLPAGADVLVFLSPISPDFALLTHTDGRPLGLVFAIVKGTRFDEEKLLAQYADRNQLRAEISGTAAVHNQQLAETRNQRREDNASLLESAGVDLKIINKVRRPSARKTSPKSPRKKPLKTPSKITIEEPDDLGVF